MTLTELIIEEFKRRIFEESYSRVFACFDELDEDQIWYRPNKNSNSIGNLVLHLEGNLRQWMTTSFDKNEDLRSRSEEFIQSRSANKKELKSILIKLKNEILLFIDKITEEDLKRHYPVQVFEENGVSIIIHVIEHFSYHTGQIAYITKQIADKDLKFYPNSLE